MQHPETFYEIRRQIKQMFDLTAKVQEAGYHHLPDHARAMQRAHKRAWIARDGNNMAEALKHLGAFWNIYGGRLEEESEYRDA